MVDLRSAAAVALYRAQPQAGTPMTTHAVSHWRPESRLFLPALAVSLGIHAATLGWLPGRERADNHPATPLLASLRLLPARTAPANGIGGETALRRPRPTGSGTPAHPSERLIPAATPVLDATPALEPSLSPRAAAAVAEPEPVRAEPSAASQPAAPPAPTDGVADTAALERYARALSDLLGRRQQYPRLAALRGWEGAVQLRLRIARKGNIVGVQLAHSSGYDVLDQHALQLVQQTARLPALPESLEEDEIQIIVPVHYRLEKAT